MTAQTGNAIDNGSIGIYRAMVTAAPRDPRVGLLAGGGARLAARARRRSDRARARPWAIPFVRAGGPWAPATASDGAYDDPAAIPMGARLQLDPAIDIDALGLPPYEATIAKALQTYGMYVGGLGRLDLPVRRAPAQLRR